MQKISSSVCAVVPVYNAVNTLAGLTQKLGDVLSRFEKHSIVLVDDGSTDGSAQMMRELCRKHEHITAVTLAKNFGQQSAVLCGLKFSDCDYTVIIDDDLEQEPADIVTLYDEMRKDYDVVYGIDSSGDGKRMHRRLGSRMRDFMFDRITRKPKEVKVCSFRIMNRKTVENVLKADTRFVYISFEILKHTNNIRSIPVNYNTAAQSKYSLLKLIKLLIKMYVYYAPGPLKILRKNDFCYIIKEVLTRESV